MRPGISGLSQHIFLLHHVHRVHRTATPVVRLRVASLLQFDGRRIRTRRHKVSADSVSRCATGSAPSGTGGKRSNTPRSTGMRGINGAPDLPLGGSSFHHPLAFGGPQGPPHGSLTAPSATRPGATCWLGTPSRSPSLSPGSASRETRGTGQAPFRRPGTCLAAGLHHARAWPKGPLDWRRPGGGPRPPQGDRKQRAWSPW